MAQDEAVRVTGEAIVVSLYPDVCLTPSGGGMVPVPYAITARFDQSIRQRPTVRFRGLEAMTDFGRITRVFGDEPGVGGGVMSGVNMGMCRPQTYSSTVRINGQHVVRHTSLIEMNCAGPDGPHNTIGAVAYPIAVPSACLINANGEIEGDTDPPVEPETEEEGGWLDWVQGGLDVVGLVPGLGEIADGANALISLGRGNYVEAGLSAAAMIPFAGWGATGAKAGLKYGDEVLQYGDEAAQAVARSADELRASEQAVRGSSSRAAREGADGVVVTRGELRRPLPDSRYSVNGYVYETDELGRVKRVEGELRLEEGTRVQSQQRAVGREGVPRPNGYEYGVSDDGGHLIGSRFGGAGEAINMVPQNSALNQNQLWKQMENGWADALGQGRNVHVDIQPVYSGSGTRPTSFNVRQTIDGESFVSTIRNTPTGR